jgi:hypothetical protein
MGISFEVELALVTLQIWSIAAMLVRGAESCNPVISYRSSHMMAV